MQTREKYIGNDKPNQLCAKRCQGTQYQRHRWLPRGDASSARGSSRCRLGKAPEDSNNRSEFHMIQYDDIMNILILDFLDTQQSHANFLGWDWPKLQLEWLNSMQHCPSFLCPGFGADGSSC